MTRTNLRAIRKIRITLLLELLAAAVFLLICYGPIAGMVIGAFNTDPVSLDHLISGRRITLLFNSLLFSALVAVAASLVGFLCASLVFQRGSKISKVLIWLPLVYLALPTYIHALSWTGLLQQINSWLINMRFEPFHLSGWGLAGWVQMLSLFPIAYGIHLVALQTLDSQVVDAARCYASEAKVFRQVILPLTKPFWVVSLVVLFLFSLADYSIPYLYAVNVYALEIFTEFSASAQYGNALITALPLLLCSFLLILWVFLKIRRISLQLGAKSMQQPLLSIWPSWIRVLQKGAFVVLVFQLLVPVTVIFALNDSFPNLFASIVDGRQEIIYSFILAFWTALTAVLLSTILARARKNRFTWLVILFPLSFPPVFVGIGEIALWNNIFNGFLYGGDWMPLLAHLARFLPISILVMSAMAGTLERLIIDCTRVFQKNPFRRLIQIYLPLLTPALFVSFILVFVFSLGELAATLLLLPPGRSTLTMRIFNFLHYGSPQAVAGLSGMLVGVAGFAAFICFQVWLIWQELMPDSGKRSK